MVLICFVLQIFLQFSINTKKGVICKNYLTECWHSFLGRILSTQTASLDTTHATPELRKSSTSPTRTTTQAPEIRKTATTKGVSNTLSSSPRFVIFKDVLTISTSSNFSDKQSGYNNWTDIKFGIAVTVLALLLVIGICFVFWWKGRSNSRNNEQRNSVYYGPVCPHSRSNR
jgi:hypothetical protein